MKGKRVELVVCLFSIFYPISRLILLVKYENISKYISKCVFSCLLLFQGTTLWHPFGEFDITLSYRNLK